MAHHSVAPALRIDDISKTFASGRPALDQVSFVLEPAEMVALIGASGSGKSTLLRHIAGFLPADAGAIEVFGRVTQRNGHIAGNIRELRADIGFVFQQFNLVNRLTVLTNVLTGLLFRVPLWRSLLARFNRAEREAALAELAAVGIAEQAYRRAGTLSGGQQQRAALARTLVQRARIILADEPIASLDPESSRNVMDILSRINRERGLTVLVSLHQIDFALRYCPRTIALHQGRVVYDGPSKNLDPATLRRIYGAAAEELLAPAIALPTRETTAFAGLAAAQAAA
ncbi:MAG: phosphonate ABC transporter ATP-binding protein [Proteobacteria bacterium]|nr:phosphonate ABC transporter ATP-binding protein [Pseudomonadota bacterium]